MTNQTGCPQKSRAAEQHDVKLSFPTLLPFTVQVICEYCQYAEEATVLSK